MRASFQNQETFIKVWRRQIFIGTPQAYPVSGSVHSDYQSQSYAARLCLAQGFGTAISRLARAVEKAGPRQYCPKKLP